MSYIVIHYYYYISTYIMPFHLMVPNQESSTIEFKETLVVRISPSF